MEKPIEMTEVVHGEEETTKSILKVFDETNQRYDVMASSAGPGIAICIEEFRQGLHQLAERGVQIRYLTDITEENLPYCKELETIAELRHLDGIKGGFAITETKYMATATLVDKQPIPHVILSSATEILEQQNYIFESFWNRSLPAAQRFEELQYGKKPEFLKQISDANQTITTLMDLASSVEHEAMVILPKGLVKSQEQMLRGFVDLLFDTARRKKAELRIIGPSIEEGWLAEALRQNEKTGIKFMEGNASNQLILIVDSGTFLRTELRTDDKSFYSSFENTLGFTAYSNSQPAIASFKSLFEMIWRHLEIIDKLNALAKSREEFITVAAHELKSPITPILLMTGLWKKGKAQDEASLKVVTRSAEKLDRVIRDVLELSRLENNSLGLEKELVDLSDVVSQLVQDSNTELAQGGKGDKQKVVFTRHHDYGDAMQIMANADKERIAEVISNLLNNALKFTEEGTISVSVGIKDNQALVSVVDNGKGIDPEIMPRLFTKYATKSHMGTGIGLYVSKNIVEAHGGKIWAENNPDGKGAAFSFTLPLATLPASSA